MREILFKAKRNDMTESDAIKTIQLDICNGCECIENCITNQCEYFLAIKAIEKQEKIKEAFEKWKTETGGYYGADDETTRFISTLNQILRSDEE